GAHRIILVVFGVVAFSTLQSSQLHTHDAERGVFPELMTCHSSFTANGVCFSRLMSGGHREAIDPLIVS
ncbi:hypothetical protein, partial [Rhodopseudomonas sp. B29]|uniref:hypothetical protein n=1 Tax=Rhodopseudomonas sp. B29 TaxID=95607 RepID=UPI001AEBC7CC